VWLCVRGVLLRFVFFFFFFFIFYRGRDTTRRGTPRTDPDVR